MVGCIISILSIYAFGGLALELGKKGIPFKTAIEKLFYVGA